MYLQQAGYATSCLSSLFVYLLQQPECVDAMYKVYERCYVLYLVALKMTDEVPSDIIGQFLMLDDKVLCLALAELAMPGVICSPYCFDRVVF